MLSVDAVVYLVTGNKALMRDDTKKGLDQVPNGKEVRWTDDEIINAWDTISRQVKNGNAGVVGDYSRYVWLTVTMTNTSAQTEIYDALWRANKGVVEKIYCNIVDDRLRQFYLIKTAVPLLLPEPAERWNLTLNFLENQPNRMFRVLNVCSRRQYKQTAKSFWTANGIHFHFPHIIFYSQSFCRFKQINLKSQVERRMPPHLKTFLHCMLQCLTATNASANGRVMS